MTAPQIFTQFIMILLIFSLFFTILVFMGLWQHFRESGRKKIKAYIFNSQAISLFLVGFAITVLSVIDFLPFSTERIRVINFILLFSAIYFILRMIYLRIDKKLSISWYSDTEFENLLNHIDSHMDKFFFYNHVLEFINQRLSLTSYLVLEVTDDIIPFHILKSHQCKNELEKAILRNHEELYLSVQKGEPLMLDSIKRLNPDLLETLASHSITLILPFTHRLKPMGAILCGIPHDNLVQKSSPSSWKKLIQQLSPRIAFIHTVQREIETQKMAQLGLVSSQLAHDFKSFLAMINLYMDDNELIQRQVKYMNKLVSDLSAYARTTRSDKEKVIINEIIQMSLDSVLIPEHIEILTHFSDELPPCEVDIHQLQRVFNNLVENSIRAMPDGGKIRIQTRVLRAKTSNNRPWVYIEFMDEGPGIPESELQKIFEPFYTTYKKKGGTGMGLAISREIIKNHSGYIDVTSKEGKGTIFNIRLPGVQEEVVNAEQ